MIENFKKVIEDIDETIVEDWVKDLVIYKTYYGLKFQEAILKKVSEISGKKYRSASKEEEAKGIDGFIGDTPVSVKPDTYKQMNSLSEIIKVKMIYYKKQKDGIKIDLRELI
jgi:hypothetical protein